MASRAGTNSVDLWSQVVGTEEDDQYQEPKFTFTYRHKKTDKDAPIMKQLSSHKENRVSFAPVKRISWNRSLSTRGRTSIAAAACVDYRHQREKPKRKTKPALPRGKVVPPPNFERERAYFQEVDSFELLEESPSPKKSGTWVMGESEEFDASHISSVLKKWLVTRKLFPSCQLSGSLSRILETPALSNESSGSKAFEKMTMQTLSSSVSIQSRTHSSAVLGNHHSSTSTTKMLQPNGDKHWEDVEIGVRNLSLVSPPSLDGQAWDPFHALLAVCGQSAPSQFSDVLYAYCDPKNISKVGEGTYGEVFLAGDTICKIVPFGGDSLVNGEVQKKSEDLLEEVVLSLTLNRLRGREGNNNNVCPTFIETINLRVCEGPYDAAMIKAWEEWDKKHCSENDHPMDFAKKQRFVIFVQEHGGQDLESFVLHNFNEARSLLVQVTVAMAVAEAGLQFEHRDLHWGNILISRKSSEILDFILDGRQIKVKTFGLSVLIIDFTLSRINNGEDILFLDLSSDPAIFEGPKGDKQAETYRKMKEVTGDCWEGSFPKTNVLWLQYLVDILLLKKSYDRSSKDERELRSLKKRLNNYGSAKEAADDPFFGDMLVGGDS